MKNFFLTLVLIVFFFTPHPVFAQEQTQFITIVNPVRISNYTKDIVGNVVTQNSVLQSNKLAATWLLTYDSITNSDLVKLFRSLDANNELGILLEVTPQFAEESGVQYNDTGFWHHATSVFLSGYLQEERIKMIDTVFAKFKDTFGYYPTSVGGWWIDSFSLTYIREKYGAIANLGLADQFSTDGYKVWGQYWSVPYYPSKYHAGIPASNESVKLDVVTVQWAPRDPFNGYFNSYYSTQDYLQKPVIQNTTYFEKLLLLYGSKNNNLFGQVVVGLESDLSPDVYLGEYKNQISMVKKLRDTGDFQVVTMSEFSEWYRRSFPNLSPSHLIETDDLLEKPVKVIWYQSPKYRIGLSHNYDTNETKVFDLRTYHTDFKEPYYISPNKEFNLSIYVPSYFDEIENSENVWDLDGGELIAVEKNTDNVNLIFERGKVVLDPNYFSVEGFPAKVPVVLLKNPSSVVNSSKSKVEFFPKDKYTVERNGFIFRDLTDVATHELIRKRTTAILLLGLSFFLFLNYLIIRSKYSTVFKLILFIFIMFPLIFYINFWYRENSQNYYVSQSEIDALVHLSFLPQGRVVVVDKECLGCEWHTEIKPAAFANKRSYVRKWGRHPIVYDSSIFDATTQENAREKFEKLKAKYIYLAKYEKYIEKTPFSPGDLGIEKIYDNANAELWRVKD